jgi:predicted HicB family RNase H-like nuclease
MQQKEKYNQNANTNFCMPTENQPSIRITRELHQRIRVHAALEDKTLNEYLDGLVPPLPVIQKK